MKAAGVFWVEWRPEGRNRQHHRRLGLRSPKETIDTAEVETTATVDRRTNDEKSGLRRPSTRRAEMTNLKRHKGFRQRPRLESNQRHPV